MVRSRRDCQVFKDVWFGLLLFGGSVCFIVCKPQSITLVQIPFSPLYVPQTQTYVPMEVPMNPFFVYYVTHGYSQPIFDASVMANFWHQLVRNDDPYIRQEFPIIGPHSEDRDAPARTPTKDSTVYKNTEVTFQEDKCGTMSTLVRSTNKEDAKENSVNSFILRNSAPSRSDENGIVLLTSNEFKGPNNTQTAFGNYSGSSFIFSNKITYGIVTQNKESPWQVAMFINGKFHCGASLIGERHVLTAAHCVSAYKNRPKILELSIGDWDLQTTEDGQNVKASVKKITTHSGFNFFNLQNDIAVLELDEKVTFNDRIKPICLPPVDLNVDGIPITITGWGRNERNLLQTKLQKLTAFSLKNSICADRWSSSGAPRSLIGARTICMDTQFGDSCKGDSGGPAVMEHPTGSGKYVQAGITSFGSGSCTDFNLPGVYTRVASFKKWIEDNLA